MTDYTAALKEAAAEYRKEVERANELTRQSNEIKREASAKLSGLMREAYASGDGMKKAAILRATDHVWSRTWLDNALKPETGETAAAE